ncbi:hypothetical protein [Nodosilinea sp. E11]|uniref:hypothetical protein n=1 Tax=Nodosilinea sp. E11 TaxID=3037479 RepID=UPI002934A3C7|nr:hypothetical protein [Nodosilinea sp. E11]WOD37374.1 hypothetical protein RRF56_02655 [Nodosilinea sp. E11]WOD37936.1 hypothetical protein RRF56_17120 [Nodosilinea sp. E11]
MPWQGLGVVAPKLKVWRAYSGAAPLAAGNAVFRVTCKNLGVGVIFKTYALVRFRTNQDGETFYTTAKRIYPRAESLVIQADIPREVRGTGILWRPEVQKVVYRNFRGRSPEPAFLVQIEHLAREAGPPPLAADNDTHPYADREDTTVDITDVFNFD